MSDSRAAVYPSLSIPAPAPPHHSGPICFQVRKRREKNFAKSKSGESRQQLSGLLTEEDVRHIPARAVQARGPGHRRGQMLLEFVIFALLLCWMLSEVQSGCSWGCGWIFLPASHVQSIREADSPFAFGKVTYFGGCIIFYMLDPQ